MRAPGSGLGARVEGGEMNVIILNEKLGITPENLFPIVRNYLVFYTRQDEQGRMINNYYRAEKSPNVNASIIHIHNIRGEWMGDISIIALNLLRSRVFITFDDWESNPREHSIAMGWGDAVFDAEKKQMFLDLGAYILGTVTSHQRAEVWLKNAREFLEKRITQGANPEDPSKPWERMSQEPAHEQIMAKLLWQDRSDEEIRDYLNRNLGMNISKKTVSNYLSHIRGKYPYLLLHRDAIKDWKIGKGREETGV
jgi:hypothetical protein